MITFDLHTGCNTSKYTNIHNLFPKSQEQIFSSINLEQCEYGEK